MPVSKSLANQGKKTHEDLASAGAKKNTISRQGVVKPEGRAGATPFPKTVGQAEKIVLGLGKG